MNRDEIANVLKSNGKIIIPMSEVHDVINTMASEIYAQKRDQRSFEKVYEDLPKVLRGGAYYYPADVLRSAKRDSLKPSMSTAGTGFRIARSVL